MSQTLAFFTAMCFKVPALLLLLSSISSGQECSNTMYFFTESPVCPGQSLNTADSIGGYAYKSLASASSLKTDGKLSCDGSQSCTDLHFSQAQAGISCGAYLSCSFAHLSSNNNIYCYGDNSCAHAIIIASDRLYASGAYSVAGAQISSHSTNFYFEVTGHFAAYGAEITCKASQTCEISCWGDSCNGLSLNCEDDSNCVQTGSFNPEVSPEIVSWADKETNCEICCMGWYDCYEENVITAEGGDVACSGNGACYSVDQLSTDFADKSVVCSGTRSCRNVGLITSAASLMCGGFFSCYRSVATAQHVYCSGYSSCQQLTLQSQGSDVVIDLTGYWSGDSLIVICEEGDHCLIRCVGYHSCLRLATDGSGNIEIECGQNPSCTPNAEITQSGAVIAADSTIPDDQLDSYPLYLENNGCQQHFKYEIKTYEDVSIEECAALCRDHVECVEFAIGRLDAIDPVTDKCWLYKDHCTGQLTPNRNWDRYSISEGGMVFKYNGGCEQRHLLPARVGTAANVTACYSYCTGWGDRPDEMFYADSTEECICYYGTCSNNEDTSFEGYALVYTNGFTVPAQSATVFINCDNVLTLQVCRHEGVPCTTLLNNVGSSQISSWVTTHIETINGITAETVVRAECRDNGQEGGFIATLTYNGVSHSTTNPMTNSQWSFTSDDGITSASSLVYTHAGTPFTPPAMADDASWVWNGQTGNTMTFTFDFSGVVTRPDCFGCFTMDDETTESGNEKLSIGTVIAAAMGSVIVVGLLAVMIVRCKSKKQRKGDHKVGDDEEREDEEDMAIEVGVTTCPPLTGDIVA